MQGKLNLFPDSEIGFQKQSLFRLFWFCLRNSVFGKRKTCLQLGLAGLANQNKVLFSQPIVAVDVAVELNSSVKRLFEFSRAFRRLQGFNSGPDWLTVILTRVVIGLLWAPFGFGFTAVIIICLFSLQSCDFYFDNPKEANERGFNFEPLKVRASKFYVFRISLCRRLF